MSYFHDFLKKHNACSEGMAFVGKKSLRQFWTTCPRPDWMLWLLDKAGYEDDRMYRLFACWCACNTPLPDGRMTWLYFVGPKPPELRWGPSPQRLPAKRLAERGYESARRCGAVGNMSSRQRQRTPIGFRDLLISLVRPSTAREEEKL